MRARSVVARVGSAKVLWPTIIACLVGFAATTSLIAQPPDPVKSPDSPPITPAELLQLLGIKPQHISLHLKEVEPQQVLDELSRQTGLTFQLVEMGPEQKAKPVTVDIDGKEFWPTLNELSKQMGVSFRRDSGTSGFRVWSSQFAQERGNGPQSQSLLGVLRADNIARSRTLSWDAESKATSVESLNLSLRLHLDPRIDLIGSSYQPTIEAAVDNIGRSLTQPRLNLDHLNMFDGPIFNEGASQHLNVSLRAPAPQAQRIAHLKGSLRLRVTTRREIWQVDVDQDKPRTKTIQRNGIPVTMSAGPWRFAGAAYEIEFAIREAEALPDAIPGAIPPAAPNRRIWGFSTFGTIRLLDAQNRELSRTVSNGRSSSSGLESRMSFSSRGGENTPGEPAKLVWVTPVEWKDVEVPFEFTDLPLP
ncbi:MAG: hypothetical protein JWN98_1220 [Abditibacteriota bacterium]|nr:hypothetical protein [Abditibacteriota bacterium]